MPLVLRRVLMIAIAITAGCEHTSAQTKRSDSARLSAARTDIEPSVASTSFTPFEDAAEGEEDPLWRQKLTAEARRLDVTHIEQFENGVFGHYNNARMFFSTTHQIPDIDRLYWVMVKVLSEKYGCFMKKRRKHGTLYRFYCRDSRSIVMQWGQHNSTLHFTGRSYDKDGNLIPIKTSH